jgi:hypothetical protein
VINWIVVLGSLVFIVLVAVVVRRGLYRPPAQRQLPVLVRLRFAAFRCPRCEVEFQDGEEVIQWPDHKLTHRACSPEAEVEGARIVDGSGFGGR